MDKNKLCKSRIQNPQFCVFRIQISIQFKVINIQMIQNSPVFWTQRAAARTQNTHQFINIIYQMQGKKYQALEEFRRNRAKNQRVERLPKSREFKARPKTKQMFLTDTQTSDYTKSSGEMRGVKIEYLENQVKELQKQNASLKATIKNMKSSNYIQINEEKVRELIEENEELRQEINNSRKQYEEVTLERDFLTRFTKNLKAECQSLTKQLIQLKSIKNQGHLHTESRHKLQYGQCSPHNNSSSEETKNHYRSTSSEIVLTRRKERGTKQYKKKGNAQNFTQKKAEGTTPPSQIIEDYFVGGSRSLASFSLKRQKY